MANQTEITPAVQRIGAVIALAEEGAEEYVQLHAAVWPEVLDALRKANVTNYSIFRRDSLLFSYMEYRGLRPGRRHGRHGKRPSNKALVGSGDAIAANNALLRGRGVVGTDGRSVPPRVIGGVMGVFSQSARTRYGVAR